MKNDKRLHVERRVMSRRKTDKMYSNEVIADVTVKNPLKMRLFLGGIFAFFTSVAIFFPLYLYLIIACWLLFDYFILLGGTLNWVNRKVDKDFKGTGFLRRILATDARIVLATTIITFIVLIGDYFYHSFDPRTFTAFQWSGEPFSHTLHMWYSFAMYTKLSFNINIGSELTFAIIHQYIYLVLIRALLLANLIHVIHHLLVNQHLAGVRFTKYPPLMQLIYRLIIWSRK